MAEFFVLILYNAALFAVLILGSPWWLWRYVSSGSFREGLRVRFFGLSGGPSRGPSKGRLWLHAVSVGEALAISRLVGELERRLPECSILVSTTTRTGQAMAREMFGAERCFYFPLDFPWSVDAALRRLKPQMLVLAESEFWPNLLSACKRNGVPVVVVNGRVSDRSLPRYVKLGVFWRPLLRSLALVLTQSEEDARRFKAIGVPSDRISLGGNLKFDIRAPQASPSTQLLKDHLHPGAKLLVCGSTLEGEEAMLLSAWEQIVGTVPEAVMLLAPRHPERFDKVAGMIAASGHPWVRRSEWIPAPAPIAAGSLILLDSIGELAGLYALATAAFLGGSLVAAGGHNPLEPAQFGVPIAMGASYENFRGAVELLMQRGAIRIVDAQRLAVELSGLLDESADTRAMGERGRAVFDEQAGATSRAAEAIVALLRKNREI